MIKEAIVTGRTVDAAIDAACEQLNLPREDVEFEIIDLPRRGFLGFSHTPAKVRVWMVFSDPVPVAAPKVEVQKPVQKPVAPAVAQVAPSQPVATPVVASSPILGASSPVAPQAAPQGQPAAVAQASKATPTPTPLALAREELESRPLQPLGDRGAAAQQYLTEVLHAMGISTAQITAEQREGIASLRLQGDEAGIAIGRRGETLDALQYLAGLAANRVGGDYCRVVLDSGNYREKRKGTLEQLAHRLASSAVKTGRPTTLEPMNPYERRIIHAAVSEIEGATSTSIGEEPNRCVVINSATSTIAPRPYSAARGGARGGSSGSSSGSGGRGSRPGAPRSGNAPPRAGAPTPPPRAGAPRAASAASTPTAPHTETLRVEDSQAEVPRVAIPREEAPRAALPRAEAPRVETMRTDPPCVPMAQATEVSPIAAAPVSDLRTASAPRTGDSRDSATRPPRRDDRRPGGQGGRREKPEPYKTSGQREVAPAEASDQPLYGKIEL